MTIGPTGADQRSTRRALLLRALAAGAVTPFVAGLLAACDQADGDETGREPTQPPESSSATEAPTTTPTIETATPTTTPGEIRPTSTPASPASASPTSTPYPPDPAQHFQITTWMPVIAMNPHIGFRKSSWVASRLTLEPLFEFDAELNPVLVLAEEWPALDNCLLDPEGR